MVRHVRAGRAELLALWRRVEPSSLKRAGLPTDRHFVFVEDKFRHLVRPVQGRRISCSCFVRYSSVWSHFQLDMMMLLGFGKNRGRERRVARWNARAAIVVIAWLAIIPIAGAQQVFSTPREAADALVAAIKSDQRRDILTVVGRSAFDVLSSGDDIADAAARKRFVEDYSQKNGIVMQGDRGATLVVGRADSPFPIPLMRSTRGWQFDTATGRLELVRARIARNEDMALEAIRTFVKAQYEYAMTAAAKDGKRRFAQRILSKPGMKDGLYWPDTNGEGGSPLQNFVEHAKADGYNLEQERSSYHGYRFKVLLRQGPKAAGGTIDYNEQGDMVHGFALIAYPVRYGHSGVLTFMVNQSGLIYQKDLGAYTTRFAGREVWFNPDQTWRRVPQSGAAN